jgi:Ca2+-binding RTX toxin-like protein
MRGSTRTAVDFKGGAGVDAVDYFEPKKQPFAFNPDGLANDGLGGDNVRNDVELYVGGDGNDQFAFPGGGLHIVFGAGGSDTMVSGPGPDELDGGYGGDPAAADGPSSDTVTYAGRPTVVNVTLDGVPNDGAPGEGDLILPTVEHVIGTDHGDTLVGPAHVPDNRPYRLDGGRGADVLSGGAGLDLLDAGPGNDTAIALGGGKDAVKCGPGEDTAITDPTDLTKDCEHVLHSYVEAASIQKGDTVNARLAIPVPRSRVIATLVSGSAVLGSRTVRLAAGLKPIAVALNPAGRAALQKAGSLPLALRVRIYPPGRSTLTKSKRVTLARK